MSDYKKIFKGDASFLGGRSRLYKSDDHFLFVDVSGYSEKYRRFYFKDIQALAVRCTTKWNYMNLAGGVLSVIFLVVFISSLTQNNDDDGSIASLIIWLIVSLPLAVNLIKGRSAQLIIQTKTSSVKTISGRFRKLQKLTDQCSAFIVDVQGDFDPVELLKKYKDEVYSTSESTMRVYGPGNANTPEKKDYSNDRFSTLGVNPEDGNSRSL